MDGELANPGNDASRLDSSPITSELQCCRNCGAFGHMDDRYCSGCGLPYDNRCSNCGAEIRHSEAVYCAVCGGRVHRLVSKQ